MIKKEEVEYPLLFTGMFYKEQVIQHIEFEIDDSESTLQSRHDLLEHVNVFEK